MPYVKPSEVDTLALPSDSSFTVTMKRRASFGDIENARAAMVKIEAKVDGVNKPKVDTQIEYSAYMQAILQRLIVSWTLTDENDQILPITFASFEKLDPVDGDFLSAEAQKRSDVRPQVKEIPFVTPSGPSSPATP